MGHLATRRPDTLCDLYQSLFCSPRQEYMQTTRGKTPGDRPTKTTYGTYTEYDSNISHNKSLSLPRAIGINGTLMRL